MSGRPEGQWLLETVRRGVAWEGGACIWAEPAFRGGVYAGEAGLPRLPRRGPVAIPASGCRPSPPVV